MTKALYAFKLHGRYYVFRRQSGGDPRHLGLELVAHPGISYCSWLQALKSDFEEHSEQFRKATSVNTEDPSGPFNGIKDFNIVLQGDEQLLWRPSILPPDWEGDWEYIYVVDLDLEILSVNHNTHWRLDDPDLRNELGMGDMDSRMDWTGEQLGYGGISLELPPVEPNLEFFSSLVSRRVRMSFHRDLDEGQQSLLNFSRRVYNGWAGKHRKAIQFVNIQLDSKSRIFRETCFATFCLAAASPLTLSLEKAGRDSVESSFMSVSGADGRSEIIPELLTGVHRAGNDVFACPTQDVFQIAGVMVLFRNRLDREDNVKAGVSKVCEHQQLPFRAVLMSFDHVVFVVANSNGIEYSQTFEFRMEQAAPSNTFGEDATLDGFAAIAQFVNAKAPTWTNQNKAWIANSSGEVISDDGKRCILKRGQAGEERELLRTHHLPTHFVVLGVPGHRVFIHTQISFERNRGLFSESIPGRPALPALGKRKATGFQNAHRTAPRRSRRIAAQNGYVGPTTAIQETPPPNCCRDYHSKEIAKSCFGELSNPSSDDLIAYSAFKFSVHDLKAMLETELRRFKLSQPKVQWLLSQLQKVELPLKVLKDKLRSAITYEEKRNLPWLLDSLHRFVKLPSLELDSMLSESLETSQAPATLNWLTGAGAVLLPEKARSVLFDRMKAPKPLDQASRWLVEQLQKTGSNLLTTYQMEALSHHRIGLEKLQLLEVNEACFTSEQLSRQLEHQWLAKTPHKATLKFLSSKGADLKQPAYVLEQHIRNYGPSKVTNRLELEASLHTSTIEALCAEELAKLFWKEEKLIWLERKGASLSQPAALERLCLTRCRARRWLEDGCPLEGVDSAFGPASGGVKLLLDRGVRPNLQTTLLMHSRATYGDTDQVSNHCDTIDLADLKYILSQFGAEWLPKKGLERLAGTDEVALLSSNSTVFTVSRDLLILRSDWAKSAVKWRGATGMPLDVGTPLDMSEANDAQLKFLVDFVSTTPDQVRFDECPSGMNAVADMYQIKGFGSARERYKSRNE